VAESWLSRHNLIVPEWSKRPDLWREAFALVEESPPVSAPCLIHHDYQQFNLLWRRGRLTGVVDWVLDPLARQESTSHTFDSISACSIQVHSLNSFSISMKRRREDRRTLVGRGGTLEISPRLGGFLQTTGRSTIERGL